jgi:hypothetical protein
MNSRFYVCPAIAVIIAATLLLPAPARAALSFSDASAEAKLAITHGYLDAPENPADLPMPLMMAGGVAAGDIDNDGDVDLYLITGDLTPNVLLQNNGNGVFTVVSDGSNIGVEQELHTGPALADFDGDGWLDLTLGGILGSGMKLFRNLGDGTFAEVTGSSGIVQQDPEQNDFSTAFGDPDGDGDLDVYIGHWGTVEKVNHLWVNSGKGKFVAGDEYAGINSVYAEKEWSFSPGFTDYNGDGRQDLLISSDFKTSHTLVNHGALQFENTTTDVIDDESGMGSTIGDFDNDGDLDWFVSSIWWNNGAPGQGNRLYQNDGAGNFTNVTQAAGVLEGDWGWSACTADFNNDGWLDIFHVNGFYSDWKLADFENDHSRLFMNDGDGTFTERSIELGITDRGQGRGLVCFDADSDGDIDIFSANIMGDSTYFRNNLSENPGWLQIKLDGELNNPSAVATRLEITTGLGTPGELTQIREVRVGSNYQSQDPLLQHFGLGGAATVDRLKVSWPHGGETVLTDLDPNQRLTLSALEASPPPFFMQAGISSAWVDPALSKEGFVIQVLPGGLAVMFWFTYDTQGKQDWYIGVGSIKGRRIFFDELLRVSGAHFGQDLEPENIVETPVGRASFTWTACDAGFMEWQIGAAMGHHELIRLSRMMGVECDRAAEQPATEMATRSGAWIDTDRDGEGYVLEILEDGTAVVFYFGFDDEGNRRWLIGVGRVEDGKLIFDEMLTTEGGNFGDPANAENAMEVPWGTLQLDIGCEGGPGDYSSIEEGFGQGSYQLTRMTTIDTLGCD